MRLIITFLLPLFCTYPDNGNGQDKGEFVHNYSLTFGLLARIKYEKPLGEKLSIGAGIKFYTYKTQQGIRTDLFSRYYFFGVLKSLYVQGRFLGGYHTIVMVYQNEGGGTLYPLFEEQKTYEKWRAGTEFDIGLQLPFPRRRGFADFNIGYNYYPFPKDIPLNYESGNYRFVVVDHAEFDGLSIKTRSVGPRIWYDPILGVGTPLKFSFTIGWYL